MWTPIGISNHQKPSDWKLAQERVEGCAGFWKGRKRPELTERNQKAVGEKGYNWKGGHASGDNRRAYLNMKAREYRADRRYHAN
jgi:hypothetical protein